MSEDNLLWGLIIILIMTSFAIAASINLFERLLFKVQKYILKRNIQRAAKIEDPVSLTEQIIRISIYKLKSDDIEKKKLGLEELYWWSRKDSINKQLIIEELINILQKEKDPYFKKQILHMLCRFCD